MLFVLLSFLPMAVVAQVEPAVTPGNRPAIIVLGDSLSAAYGMELSQSWPSLLQQRLNENGYAYQVFNSSITGDTTQGGLARLPRLLDKHEPDIVILELGGNDGLRGLSLTAMKGNLAAMISSLQQTGAQLLLIGVQLPPNYGPRYTDRFQAVYRELAREHDVALLPSLVDGIGTEQNLMQSDGIHPNATAQPLIRDRVWEELLPLLEQAGRSQPAPPG